MKKKSTLYRTNGGQAVITAVIFFLVISLIIVVGVTTPIANQVRNGTDFEQSIESYSLSDSSLEDALYRLKTGKSISTTETMALNGGTSTVTISDIATGKQVTTSANVNNFIRKVKATLALGTGVAFHYGIQGGQGGFVLQNSSSVTGNVYSGGTVTGSGNFIYGDVVSSGGSGLVSGIHSTGSVFAHTIGKSGATTVVDKDAYYTTLINTSVAGVKYASSTDQATSSLPISDDQISEWESDAAAGGIMASSACDSYSSTSNTCTITSSMTLGPIKIPFNLVIKSSSAVITVAGPIWVTGNITLQTGPTILMASSLGNQNAAVIADDPTNQLSGSLISIGQSTIFQNSGSSGSFVFMISQNNSSENGGSIDAISMSQGASALVAYASHGQISLSQSVNIKEVTAYKIILSQSANVTYDTGLPSVLFEAGPSGGYDMLSWQEIP